MIDGGSGPTPAALARLNALPRDEAAELLHRCCGSRRWVEGMLGRRPFATPVELVRAADDVWSTLDRPDFLEAFSHHPQIGEDLARLRERFAATADLSRVEQAGAALASEATLVALARGNAAYRARFGFVFIVCARGKSAEEMRRRLEQRLPNDAAVELAIAAAEQAKITRLRLENIGS